MTKCTCDCHTELGEFHCSICLTGLELRCERTCRCGRTMVEYSGEITSNEDEIILGCRECSQKIRIIGRKRTVYD